MDSRTVGSTAQCNSRTTRSIYSHKYAHTSQQMKKQSTDIQTLQECRILVSIHEHDEYLKRRSTDVYQDIVLQRLILAVFTNLAKKLLQCLDNTFRI